MAVRSRGMGIYEFTASDDMLLEVVKVESFEALTTTTSGDVTVISNIINPATFKNGAMAYSATNESPIWRAALNANSMAESAIDVGFCYGIKVTMPPGGTLIVFTAFDG